MKEPNFLLKNALNEIENRIKEDISPDFLANILGYSLRHLQRLFKAAFKQTIGTYIRSRKLAVSTYDLLNTDLSVLEIALDYGFEYEQSYIRSFKREFGTTPGKIRRTNQIVKVKPPQ
jgi:AraC family transcriptional regulator